MINLLIPGFRRSGTTTLFAYLSLHPSICCSEIKEIHFFSFDDQYARGQKYLDTFFNTPHLPIVASADTYLMLDRQAPDRIYPYNPDMKFIVLMRHPTERAYSSFRYAKNNGYDKSNLSLIDSLMVEKELTDKNIIIRNNLSHFSGSLYHKQLSIWTNRFPRKNFLLLTSDELFNRPQLCLNKIADFLNIPPFPEGITPLNVNKAAEARNKKLQQILLNREHPLRRILRQTIPPALRTMIINSGIVHMLSKANRKEKPYRPMTEEERMILNQYFAEDMQKLKEDFGITFADPVL